MRWVTTCWIIAVVQNPSPIGHGRLWEVYSMVQHVGNSVGEDKPSSYAQLAVAVFPTPRDPFVAGFWRSGVDFTEKPCPVLFECSEQL